MIKKIPYEELLAQASKKYPLGQIQISYEDQDKEIVIIDSQQSLQIFYENLTQNSTLLINYKKGGLNMKCQQCFQTQQSSLVVQIQSNRKLCLACYKKTERSLSLVISDKQQLNNEIVKYILAKGLQLTNQSEGQEIGLQEIQLHETQNKVQQRSKEDKIKEFMVSDAQTRSLNKLMLQLMKLIGKQKYKQIKDKLKELQFNYLKQSLQEYI